MEIGVVTSRYGATPTNFTNTFEQPDRVKVDLWVDVDTGIMYRPTKNSGIATILSGGTNVTVAHGLAGTPRIAIVTGRHGETSDAYVSARDDTNITITVPAAVTADRIVDWYVEL